MDRNPTLVVVETMPRHLRASHEAAGNRGRWPHNGARREVLPLAEAREVVHFDPEWSEILEDEDPTPYLDDE